MREWAEEQPEWRRRRKEGRGGMAVSVDFPCGYRRADGKGQPTIVGSEGEGRAKRVAVSLPEEEIFLCWIKPPP